MVTRRRTSVCSSIRSGSQPLTALSSTVGGDEVEAELARRLPPIHGGRSPTGLAPRTNLY